MTTKKQKIEMQELPAGVFTFDEIGLIISHLNYDRLLAITSVESYNNNINDFPLSVLDLENIPDLVLTKAEYFINLDDLTSRETDLSADNETLQEYYEGKLYLVLFDPKTGERISWR